MKIARFVLYLIFIVILLIAFRILEFGFLWKLPKAILKEKVITNSFNIQVEDIGFSLNDHAMKLIEEKRPELNKTVLLIRYFDLIHPSVLLIYSKENINMPFFNGHCVLNEGFTKIFFFKNGFVYIKRNNDTIKIYFPIVRSNLFKFPNIINDVRLLKNIGEVETKIYFYYCWIPFIIIMLLAYLLGKKVYFSFFYFFEMLFLFSAFKFLYSAPALFFTYIKKLIKIETLIVPISIVSMILMFFLYIYFFVKILSAFKSNKSSNFKLIEIMIVLFFILLPFNLRF